MWLLKLPTPICLLHTGQSLECGGLLNSARAEVVTGGVDMGGAVGIGDATVAGDGSDDRDDGGAVDMTLDAMVVVTVDVSAGAAWNERLSVRRTEAGTPVRNGDELPATVERVRGRDMWMCL